MSCLSFLTDNVTPLILDTSVLINLHACSYGEEALAAMPNKLLVSDIVVRELSHETSHSNGENEFILRLMSKSIIQVVKLDDDDYQIYETLICGVGSLDDGEAATIAVAVAKGFVPVIDERKGRARAAALIGGRLIAWSLDLFLHPSVEIGLSGDGHNEAIYLALRDGRMRIDEQRCDAVVKLIGVERALHCNSLPGFKARREVWKAMLGK